MNLLHPKESRGEHHHCLVERLEKVIHQLPSPEVTLAEIMGIIGNDSLLFLSIFLSLVFLVPVSIPGVSTVFGSAILLIGVSQLLRRNFWLPERIASRTITTGRLTVVLQRALAWFRFLNRFSRPRRLERLAIGSRVGFFNRISFILAAVLLMVPLGFVPFSNTLPALALILLAFGVLQKDGASILAGHLANLATILYFALLITGGGYTLLEALRHFTS
jgi:hypothetical protein